MYVVEALCALAVALLFADVKAQTELEFTLPSYPVRDYAVLLFRVTCTSNCTIDKIIVDGYTGSLQMSAVDASSKFCLNQTKECPGQQLNTAIFYITLEPKPEFTGGKLTVLLGQKGVIDELDADSASTFGETGSHDQKYVLIKSGSFTIKFPKLPRLFEIRCNGSCRNIDIQSRTKEKAILVGAKDPVFLTNGGCYNCFCASNRNQGYFQQCVKGSKKKFDLQKSSIYVTIVPDKEIKKVRATVTGDNIKSIKEYIRNPDGWPVYDTKDGYRAGVFRLMRALRGSKAMFAVYCKVSTRCDDIKIEVFADLEVKTIHAGKMDMNGICEAKGCFCTSVASCKKRTSPTLYLSDGKYYWFGVYIIVGKSQRNYPGYVKVSGKHVHMVVYKNETML